MVMVYAIGYISGGHLNPRCYLRGLDSRQIAHPQDNSIELYRRALWNHRVNNDP